MYGKPPKTDLITPPPPPPPEDRDTPPDPSALYAGHQLITSSLSDEEYDDDDDLEYQQQQLSPPTDDGETTSSLDEAPTSPVTCPARLPAVSVLQQQGSDDDYELGLSSREDALLQQDDEESIGVPQSLLKTLSPDSKLSTNDALQHQDEEESILPQSLLETQSPDSKVPTPSQQPRGTLLHPELLFSAIKEKDKKESVPQQSQGVTPTSGQEGIIGLALALAGATETSTSGRTPVVTAVPFTPTQDDDQDHQENVAANNNINQSAVQGVDNKNKTHRNRWYLVFAIACVIMIAVAVTVGLTESASNKDGGGATADDPISPTRTYKCFVSTAELTTAVDKYLDDDSSETAVAKTYGWPIQKWCVKGIRNFVQLFSADRNPKAVLFDDPLGSWNVSSARKMGEMFLYAQSFDQDLSMWDISLVSDMTRMFRGAARFNQDLCSWQPVLAKSSVQVQDMFLDTSCTRQQDPTLTASDAPGGYFCALCPPEGTQFPGKNATTSPSVEPTSPPITDKPTVAPIPPSRCFASSEELYDAVDRYLANNSHATGLASEYGWPINNWCVSQITDFGAVFSWYRNNATATFNERLDGWDVSNAVRMKEMFRGQNLGHSLFNQDLNSWNTSRVTDMRGMFRRATSFNGRISSWNTSSVTGTSGMFLAAHSFQQNISAWDVSNVRTMHQMFVYAKKFAGDLSEWNVSNVENMSSMFHGSASFNSDLSAWDVRKVDDMLGMFRFTPAFEQNLCSWGPQLQGRNVQVTNMFNKSGCPTTMTPNLTATPPGPFCFVCE